MFSGRRHSATVSACASEPVTCTSSAASFFSSFFDVARKCSPGISRADRGRARSSPRMRPCRALPANARSDPLPASHSSTRNTSGVPALPMSPLRSALLAPVHENEKRLGPVRRDRPAVQFPVPLAYLRRNAPGASEAAISHLPPSWSITLDELDSTLDCAHGRFLIL
jgi:hypothetical protein